MEMVRKIVEFQFILQKELKRMTDADGEGQYRSVVRLVVVVSDRLGLIGGLFVRVDGSFAGRLLFLPANAV